MYSVFYIVLCIYLYFRERERNVGKCFCLDGDGAEAIKYQQTEESQ